MISGMKTGKRWGTEESRRAIAGFFNKSYEDFLSVGNKLIQAEKTLNTQPATLPNKPPVLSIHHQIIEQFEQKELALEINQGMLELERMNPDELKEVAKYVQYRRSEAKKMLPPEPQKKRS